jgi:histidine ammonia-lyase
MPQDPTRARDPSDCILGDAPLTIERIDDLSRAPRRLILSADARRAIDKGRAIVERILTEGTPIYGTTTGIGSQKDVNVDAEHRASFGDRMIVSEATDYPGPAYEPRVVRAALLILIHNLASGRTGVRLALVEALLDLLASPNLPTIRRDASFGAADLTPLAQLSLSLIGRSLNDGGLTATGTPWLAPKESVSLLDNNSFALGDAALALAETKRLLAAFDLAAAASCEGFRADVEPYHEAAAGGHRGIGRRLAREHLHRLLVGSRLWNTDVARFLQDPLSFRGLTLTHGAGYEAWQWASTQVETEIAAASDNPIVDLEAERLLTSSSMTPVTPVLALDCLRQALAKIAVLSMERSLKVQSPPFSGLPVGLSEEGHADGGILSINLHYVGAARLGSLTAAAAPVLLNYIGQMADGVEDVTTLFPLSVTQTWTVIDRAWEIAALELTVAVWAIARRCLAPSDLGAGPRLAYDRLLPLLHIGEEGNRIFDMTPIVERIRHSDLIERALPSVCPDSTGH